MKKVVFVCLIFLLFYTRFVNLGWGLPYPMHPDERNMAVAVQSMNCNFEFDSIKNCLNPHFFAYGQLPLFLAYAGVQLLGLDPTIALRALSALSSLFLVFVSMKIVELISKLNRRLLTFDFRLLTLVFFIFQPYMIQFSHFGTTESLLMLFYSLIIYFSLKLVTSHYSLVTILLLGAFSGLALGTKTSSILFLGVPILVIFIKGVSNHCAIGVASKGTPTARTKYLPAGYGSFGAPMGYGMSDGIYRRLINTSRDILLYVFISSLFFLLSSPHSLLNWTDFISSMNYESAVGLGTYIPFYTRQFIGTTPLLFQFTHILPSVLGWPQLLLAILGFILLPWTMKQKGNHFYDESLNSKQYAKASGPLHGDELGARWEVSSVQRRHRWHMRELLSSCFINPYNILRFALLISFLPPSFFFAKWTRFIAPSFPLFSLFALLFFIHLFQKVSSFKFQVSKYILFIAIILPGIAFLSIYSSPDVRFTASEWIYKNIPAGSKILTETANVINLPIPPPNYALRTTNYALNSFNFYDLDANPQLQLELAEALKQADYIIVPSRRIFKNHTCLSPQTAINSQQLANDCPKNYELRTTHYALLNKYYSDLFSGSLGFEQVAEFSSYPKIGPFSFSDESAEETWTVFDHPVIRIYKRRQKLEDRSQKQTLQKNNLDFSNYQTILYQFPTSPYSLVPSHSLLVADSAEKWGRGLMFVNNRDDIGGADGMIFTFPDSKKRTFWNKNTLSHLTLYWINKGKVIDTSDMSSITETNGVVATYSSPSEVDTVIEIIDEKK